MNKAELRSIIKNMVVETPDYLKVAGGYKYPDDLSWPGCADVKRWAARAARARNAEVFDRALFRLGLVMRTLDRTALKRWAEVVMIDARWCGATGTGAYWAVASRHVNEAAQAELKRRSA